MLSAEQSVARMAELQPLLAPDDDGGKSPFTPAMVELLPDRFKSARWRWVSLWCVFAMVSLGTAPVGLSSARFTQSYPTHRPVASENCWD